MKRYKIMKFIVPFLVISGFLACAPVQIMAQAPYSNQPMYDPNIPVEFGSGSSRPLVPLPPHLPEYLPNGAINLDEVWIQDGGARLYWNTVIIPTQLKMGGATWIDPALVPQLFPQKYTPPRRRYRSAAKSRAAKVKIPAGATSTSLTPPAIPLPVTPVVEEKQQQDIPPLTASSAQPKKTQAAPAHTSPAAQEDRSIAPPPLQ